MSASLTIALDAMGGDNAPAIVVKGADFARHASRVSAFTCSVTRTVFSC